MNIKSKSILHIILLILCSFLPNACTHKKKNRFLSKFRRSVFKIETTHKNPNFVYPWNHKQNIQSSGTGFYIGNNHIMTNAHVVANGRHITVIRDGDSQKKIAKVIFIAHDNDLALLEVEDPKYFYSIAPAKFGNVPKLLSPVTTVGYPVGGEQVSTTEGVVSRLRYAKYTHSGFHQHLMIQVDSAINPGNSGGPVVQNGKVVGVAFQAFTQAQNTGYIIPTPVVERFLKDIKDGKYDGHPYSGIHIQEWATSNPSLRESLKLPKDKQGALVSYIELASSAKSKIEVGDIILEVDGHAIGDDGKIELYGERVSLQTIFDMKMQGETITYKIFRNEKTIEVKTDLSTDVTSYDPAHYYGRYPRFYVYAGLLFNMLSREYLQTWGNKWYTDAPFSLLYIHYYNEFIPEVANNKDIIVLGGTMPHPINNNITTPRHSVVKSVNDTEISSLDELKHQIENATDDFIKIGFYNDLPDIILHRQASLQAHTEIINGYRIDPPYWLENKDVDGAVFVNQTANEEQK